MGEKDMKFNSLVKGGLAAAMAFSMMACGGSSSSASSSAPVEAADGSVVIKIGGSGPTTGGAAQYGQAVENAFKLACDEVNASDSKIKFDYRFEDDQHDPEKAASAYGVLKDWGMQVSIGTTTSGPGQNVSPLYKEDHIFALTPSASSLAVIYEDSANMTNAFGTVFQMCFTDPNQGIVSADYISKHPDLGTKVGIIWKSDDNYSTGVHETFTAEAAKVGLDIVFDATFTNDTANDFSVQLTQAKDAGADLLYMPMYYDPASLILGQANAMGYAPTFFGIDGMDGILSLENFDKSLAEGVYLLYPANTNDERTAAFFKNYQDKYGDVPNQFAVDAYDCVYAIRQALENANAESSMSASEICDLLVSQFTSMTYDGITGKNITWNANGEVSKTPLAVKIVDGAYAAAE